jgi:hypothetical protein
MVLLLCLSFVKPVQAEGTLELGLTAGLSQSTVIHVDIASPDERLLFCSSDDGVQSPPVDGQSIDLSPGDNVDKDPLRDGADIIVYPPTEVPCDGAQACPVRQICFNRALELPFEFGPSDINAGFCGYPFRVSPTEDIGAGFCDAQTLTPQYFELDATEVGVWRFDFVGEASTTGAPQRNTRFFDVTVENAQGEMNSSSRMFSYQWYLSTHAPDQESDHTFFIRRRVGDQVGAVEVNLEGASQFSYGLLSNREGILENLGFGSQCERVVDETQIGQCPLSIEGRRALLTAQLPLYLATPVNADTLTPTVTNLFFQDDQGTTSISPNDDGIQDSAAVTFESTLPGILRLWIDINGDGAVDDPREIVLKRTFQSGAQRIPWLGTDRFGTRLAPGQYRFSLYFSFGEYHVVALGLESLSGLLNFVVDGNRNRTAYWNDTQVFQNTTVSHLQTPWHVELAERSWREETWPMVQRPVLFDTWSNLESSTLAQANCVRCDEPFNRFRVGPMNEVGDNDLDGLANDEEDLNGNGQIDPGETDPNDPDTDGDGLDDKIETRGEPSPVRPDTDQDGLDDGVEDESGDGFFQEGETDSTDPDTDGDRLYDGQEDRNGNGRVDPGETDPRLADTDGDGIDDADDPFPLDPAMDSGFSDGIIPLATGDGDAFGLGSDATMDIENTSGYEENGFLGCDCSSHESPVGEIYVIMLGLMLTRVWRRTV